MDTCFFTRHKDTKKSIHIQIISVVSSFNGVISRIIIVVLRNHTDNLGMDADKNDFLIR